MTPRHVDADAWRLVVIIGMCAWLAVDPSPLGWPYYVWLVGLGVAIWIYQELRGPVDDDLDAPTEDEE